MLKHCARQMTVQSESLLLQVLHDFLIIFLTIYKNATRFIVCYCIIPLTLLGLEDNRSFIFFGKIYIMLADISVTCNFSASRRIKSLRD